MFDISFVFSEFCFQHKWTINYKLQHIKRFLKNESLLTMLLFLHFSKLELDVIANQDEMCHVLDGAELF